MILIIKWYLILLAISYIFAFKRKRLRTNQLHCGLFGFCGDPKIITATTARLIQAKIKILGLYNIERGKHSCGIFINNQVFKGVDNDKIFSDFIQNHELPDATQSGNYTVIGHTRQATHGSHVASNAHPFVIDQDFVLAHNGVIKNIWGLLSKYKINQTNIHVDSDGLAHLINKEGFKILNEYEGFAALLMTRGSEPNTLYFYRGASKRTTNGEEEEERPLYYMQSPEGIYVSSMDRSLLAISDSVEDRIKIVESNVVHKITNGRMTKSKFHVQRGDINLPKIWVHSGGTTTHPTTGTGQTTRTVGTSSTNSTIGNTYPASPVKTFPLIWFETIPNRIDKYKASTGIIFHMGRYWVVDKEEIKIAHGSYYINRKGRISDQKSRENHNYFFFEGILMRNEKCYNAAITDIDLKDIHMNFAMFVSKYAEYPVANTRSDLTSRCKNVIEDYKHCWFHNTNMLTAHGFTPRWSDRNYTIRSGKIFSIASNRKDEHGKCIDSVAMEAANKPQTPKTDIPVEAKVPPVNLTSSIVNELPFDNIGVGANGEKILKECDLTNFYRHFTNADHIKTELTDLEMNAIRFYVADIMRHEMEIDVKNINDMRLSIQVDMMLNQCCDTVSTLIDVWDEKNYNDVLHYLLIAQENPDGNCYDDEEPVEDGEACEVPPPKPVITDEQYVQYVADSYAIPETDVDAEPPMIEIAAQHEREQAQVPEGDEDLYKEEEESDTTERDYEVKDTIDYAYEVRECADQLASYQNDEFAQKVANVIYRNIDPLIHSIMDLADTHKEEEIREHIIVATKGLIKS